MPSRGWTGGGLPRTRIYRRWGGAAVGVRRLGQDRRWLFKLLRPELSGPVLLLDLVLDDLGERRRLEAVDLAGPSKFIVKVWHRGAALGSKISPLYGKFPMAYEHVREEVRDMMQSKKRQQLPK